MWYTGIVAIASYSDEATRDIAAAVQSKRARQRLPENLHSAARRRLAFLAAAESLNDLRAWPGLNVHDLKEDRAGQFAIRINDKYRICFNWNPPDASSVEITDYH